MDDTTLAPQATHSPRSTPGASSPSTTVTTPDQSPGADDDIWETSSPEPHDRDRPATTSATNRAGSHDVSAEEGSSHPAWRPSHSIPSDLPSLRRQHMTSGYREGLAVGKASVMQAGFDAGYPFGVEIGLRVGTVLGVLEGLVVAGAKGRQRGRGSGPEMETETNLAADFTSRLYRQAEAELKVAELVKMLDDEKVAGMETWGTRDADEQGVGGKAGAVEMSRRRLPAEIEHVLQRWERLVLGSLSSVAEEEKKNGGSPSQ